MKEDAISRQMKAYGTYLKVREKHPDVVILIRLVDDYIVFDEDSDRVGNLFVDVTGKADNDGKARYTKFAQRGLDINLPKMIRNGFRVCICDYYSN